MSRDYAWTEAGRVLLPRQTGVSGIVPNVIPQPFLIFEQQAKPDGDLPVLIALVSRRKRTRIAQ
jgi:hypothetical protein